MKKAAAERKENMVLACRNWFKTHRYCLVLLYMPAYLCYFGFLERFPPARFHLIRCPLDRLIPTIPAFFAAYALWWLLFPGAIFYFLLKGSREDFLKLCFILFSGYTICLFIYTVYPNGLAIREPLEGRGLFSRAILWLRSIDPPQHVCPSMHVSSTVSIDLVSRESPDLPPLGKKLVSIAGLLIILSTLFIKQHSVIDVLLGIAISLLLWFIWGKTFGASSKRPSSQ